MGRTFDNSMLDFFEMEVANYKGLKEFQMNLDITPGARPVVMFLGDVWEGNSDYERI